VERISRGIEKAKQCSWESTVQSMQGLIKEAINKKDRRSARKIAPLGQAELEYIFQATQGS
jgi:ribosomal protein S3AE